MRAMLGAYVSDITDIDCVVINKGHTESNSTGPYVSVQLHYRRHALQWQFVEFTSKTVVCDLMTPCTYIIVNIQLHCHSNVNGRCYSPATNISISLPVQESAVVSGLNVQWYVFYWNRVESGVLTFLDVEFVLLAGMKGALCGGHPCMI